MVSNLTVDGLTTATPRDIDETLADLHNKLDAAQQRRFRALDTMHYLLGERPSRQRRRVIAGDRGWPTTDEHATEAVRTASLMPWEESRRDDALARHEQATTEIEALTQAIHAGDAEFDRRGGWSRFFRVLPDGHVHSGLRCDGGSIRPTTRVAWNPHLSGKECSVAVAELGPLLCSHCFPTAPAEWRYQPQQDDGKCTSKTPVNPSPARRMYRYGTCGECGRTGVSLTKHGYLRKHTKGGTAK